MIKHSIINADLGHFIAQARHGDAIIVCDANMPIPNGCNVIDLSLTKGIPTTLQVLKAILNDMVAERYQVFELMPQYNPQMYQVISETLSLLPGGLISKENLMQLMPSAKVVVRTGDFGSCCTAVLYSASGMDKYVNQFNCQFLNISD